MHLITEVKFNWDQSFLGPSWSLGSWIISFLCIQCLSPLTLRVWILPRWGVLDTTLRDKVCQWLATGQWFSPVSSTNKTDCHDITEILLKVALNIITQPSPSIIFLVSWSKYFVVHNRLKVNLSQIIQILKYFKVKSTLPFILERYTQPMLNYKNN